MRRRMRIGLAVLAVALASGRAAAQQPGDELLEPPEVTLTAVEDSSDYFVYRYRVANPAGSPADLGTVKLDVSAAANIPHRTLPGTGPFIDGVDESTRPDQLADHVPIGPISPEQWEAFLTGATLDWYGTVSNIVRQEDKIEPGASVSGFGLRSPYLPGIRTVKAEPTWPACCREPVRDDPNRLPGAHPSPDEFQVATETVGPTVPPEEIDLGLLEEQLSRACELGWISNRGICNSLRQKLRNAGRSMDQGRTNAARNQLRAFLDELEAQHGPQPGKHVDDNAFGLLKTNAEAVLEGL